MHVSEPANLHIFYVHIRRWDFLAQVCIPWLPPCRQPTTTMIVVAKNPFVGQDWRYSLRCCMNPFPTNGLFTAQWDRAWGPPIVFRCASYPPMCCQLLIFIQLNQSYRVLVSTHLGPRSVFSARTDSITHTGNAPYNPRCAFFTLIDIYLMSPMTQILHQSMILSLASVIQWDSFVSTNHNAWIVSAQATRRAQPPIPIPILQNPYFNYRLLFCYSIFF